MKKYLYNWKLALVTFIVLFITLSVNIPDDKSQSTLANILSFLIFFNLIWIIISVIYLLLKKGKSITNKTKMNISHNLSKKKIKQQLLNMLDDEMLTDREENELREHAQELGLTEKEYIEIRTTIFNDSISSILKKIKKSKRYSPDDEIALKKISEQQQVNIDFSLDFLTQYRQLWEIENTGEFTPQSIDVHIRLTTNEICYFEAISEWKREKRIKKHKGYIGGSIGFRVAKGVTFRVGKAVPLYDEYDDIVSISEGTLYVTNKKIVFIGDKKSTNITLGKFADYELYRDAIKINKTSGPPDIFTLNEDDMLLLDALLQTI